MSRFLVSVLPTRVKSDQGDFDVCTTGSDNLADDATVTGLAGMAGDDILTGGTGRDQLTAGLGEDCFAFGFAANGI